MKGATGHLELNEKREKVIHVNRNFRLRHKTNWDTVVVNKIKSRRYKHLNYLINTHLFPFILHLNWIFRERRHSPSYYYSNSVLCTHLFTTWVKSDTTCTQWPPPVPPPPPPLVNLSIIYCTYCKLFINKSRTINGPSCNTSFYRQWNGSSNTGIPEGLRSSTSYPFSVPTTFSLPKSY